MAIKLFWVKYLYIEGIYEDLYHRFNKILPGQWTEEERPKNLSYSPRKNKYKADHKRVWCESKDDLYKRLFDYEHKRNNKKHFIWILRYVELPIKNCRISATVFEVHYKVICLIDFSNTHKKQVQSTLYDMGLRMPQAGHAGYVDKEVVVFKKADLPTEDNLIEALLDKLPPAPVFAKRQITRILRHDPVSLL